MKEVFILTYFPGTSYEMILGVFSSIENAAKKILDNEIIKPEYKPAKEELELVMRNGEPFISRAFKVQRFFVD